MEIIENNKLNKILENATSIANESKTGDILAFEDNGNYTDITHDVIGLVAFRLMDEKEIEFEYLNRKFKLILEEK